MKRFLILAFILISPNFVVAETLRIRSGNHPEFARLVIYGSNSSSWIVEKTDGGFELVTNDPDSEFEYSEVFRRIPKDRLLGLEARQEGRLFLPVTCDCHVSTFEIAQGLVVDIVDGPSSDDVTFSALNLEPVSISADELRQSNGPPELVFGDEIPLVWDLEQRFNLARTDILWEDDISLEASQFRNTENSIENVSSFGEIVPSESRVLELERELIAQIGRASIQGIVEADISEFELPQVLKDESVSHESSGENAGVMDNNVQSISNSSSDHVRFETALDRGSPNPKNIPSTTTSGEICLPDELFDVASWGDNEGSDIGLFVGRISILGEFDTVDDVKLKNLIQKYIYLSFGAEANSLISAFGQEIENNLVYTFLAEIMDSGYSDEQLIERSQVECESRVAFWAFLANHNEQNSLQIPVESIMETFGELPLHLRQHLGPYLAERFLTFGDIEAANEVVNVMARPAGNTSPARAMIEAEIDFLSGEPIAGLNGMEEIFRSSGPLASEAAVRLVDESINNDFPLPKEMSVVTAALAHEANGTPIGSELLRVKVRTEANEGRILNALRMLNKLGVDGSLDEYNIQETTKEILEIVANNVSDNVFVQAIFIADTKIGMDIQSIDLRRRIATRLSKLGFQKRARKYLIPNEPLNEELDQIIIAETYIKENSPANALDVLRLFDSDSAILLKGRANVALGNIDEAISLFQLVDEGYIITDLQWERENLNYDYGEEEDVRNRISAMVMSENLDNDEFEVNIENSNSILENSIRIREISSELLVD